MSNRISNIISEYRRNTIIGKIVDLVPFSEEDIDNVIEIRNREKNRYYLNQGGKIDYCSQKKWYDEYLKRDNDLYWCVYNKKHEFVGTIRVYDINEIEDICDQGSFMIDENQPAAALYALEAEVLSLDFIFEKLKVAQVINEDKIDNKLMNNLSKKLGFIFEKKVVINECEYNYYLLNSGNYYKNRNKFQTAIDYWMDR